MLRHYRTFRLFRLLRLLRAFWMSRFFLRRLDVGLLYLSVREIFFVIIYIYSDIVISFVILFVVSFVVTHIGERLISLIFIEFQNFYVREIVRFFPRDFVRFFKNCEACPYLIDGYPCLLRKPLLTDEQFAAMYDDVIVLAVLVFGEHE